MTKSKLFIVPLLIAFTLQMKSCSQVSEAETQFDLEQTRQTLTAEINKILKDTGIPSISISLIKDSAIVWSEAFGYANVRKKVPATPSTIYCTGSCFKFVTATAIMQLTEAGKLDIDDPVNDYLGDYAIDDLSEEGTHVTFRHLLSHYSGLSGPIEIIPLWDKKLPKTLEEIASQVQAEKAPGEEFRYCNHCYALAGLVIEKVSGQSFQDYIVEHILKPLKISSEGPVIPTPEMIEELALPYGLANNKPVPTHQLRFDVFPAGDIYLTSPEMAHFLIAQLNQGAFQDQSILNPESTAEMQKEQFGSNYGLGTGVMFVRDKKILTHSGGVPGFSTIYRLEPESKTGVYIASNAGSVHDALGAIADLSLKLLNGVDNIKPLPSFAKTEFEEIDLDDDVLRKHIGRYQLTPEFIITITLEEDQLFAQATGQDKYPIFPYGENKFFYKIVHAQIHFNIKEYKVTSLTLFQNGERKAKKIE